MKKSDLTWLQPNKYKKNYIIKKYWNRSSFEEVLVLKVQKLSKELILVEWKYINDSENKWKTIFKKTSENNWKNHHTCSESTMNGRKFNPNKITTNKNK